MASSELEEKINKIRLQNEKIRQRYEEVEADKKNAAKLNALVQLVPSDDWPERKEPPEFSAPLKNTQKPKALSKEHSDRSSQHYTIVQERHAKKDHKFAQGDGPPPDPKYNFLADSERESRAADDGKSDEDKNRSRNKASRGALRRRGAGGNGSGGSKEAYFKDNRGPHAFHSKGESLPEYEAWRAERDRIDEARINRQKTAEGNWRREWDCNKVNIEKEPETLRKVDSSRKEYDRRNNQYDNDYSRQGGSRTYHGSQKNHGSQDYRRSHHEPSQEYKRQPDNKQPFSPLDDRTVTATDKSIKVTVSPGSQAKGQVMSVKVSSPSIAGTGRVGPRQKSRVTYSSQSDADAANQELDHSPRQKSHDEKTSGANYNSGQKSTPKSPFAQRKKEGNPKSPYPQRKEFRNDESSARPKNPVKSSNTSRNEHNKDQRQSSQISKPQRVQKRAQKTAAETIQNVPTSDDALPPEYNPNKLHNSESVTEQTVDTGDVEKTLHQSNQTDEGSPDASKNLEDSSHNYEFVNQNTCGTNVENFKCQNIKTNENSDVSGINEDGTLDENIKNPEIDNIPKNVKIEICKEDDFVKTNENDLNSENVDKLDGNIEKNETEIDVHDNTIQYMKEQKNEENPSTSEEVENEPIEKPINNIYLLNNIINSDIEMKTELEVSSEGVYASTSEETKANERINNSPIEEALVEPENENLFVKHEEKVEEKLSYGTEKLSSNTSKKEDEIVKEKKNEEIREVNNQFGQISIDLKSSSDIEKIINDIEIESTETKETELANSETPLNTFLNDSGTILNDSGTSKIDNFQNLSNDSGYKSDISIIEPNSNTDIRSNPQETVESDPVDVTKENCEKSFEICDNRSAGETIQAVDDQMKNDNLAVSESSGNSTKDSQVVKDDKSSETIIEKMIQNESSNEVNSMKEESVVAAEEAKTD